MKQNDCAMWRVLSWFLVTLPLAAQPAAPLIERVTVSGTVVTVDGSALDGRESAGVFSIRLGAITLSVQSASPTQIVATAANAVAPGTYPLAIVFKEKNGNRPDTAAPVLRADVTAGANGAVGPMGPQGPAGPQGLPGPIGLTGPAGPAGPSGPQGPIGLTGPAGPQGETGATGPAGPAGPQGLAGPAGPVGPAGPIGPQGVAGPVGPAGPQGPIGVTGPAGPIGPQGLVGPTGPAGPQGTPGPNTKAIATLRWYSANLSSVLQVPGVIWTSAAFDGENMWLATATCCPSIRKVKAADFSTVLVQGGVGVNTIVADGRFVWAGTSFQNSVAKFDAATGSFLGNIFGVSNPTAMMFDGMHVWATNPIGGNVSRITVTTSAVSNFPSTAGGEAIAFDGQFVWIAGSGMLVKLNPATGAQVATYLYGGGATGGSSMAFDGTHLWVSHSGSAVVGKYRVSDGGHVGSYAVPATPQGVVFDGTHIWVASVGGSGSVTKLRASDGGLVGTYNTAAPAIVGGALSFDGSNVWVLGGTSGAISKM